MKVPGHSSRQRAGSAEARQVQQPRNFWKRPVERGCALPPPYPVATEEVEEWRGDEKLENRSLEEMLETNSVLG